MGHVESLVAVCASIQLCLQHRCLVMAGLVQLRPSQIGYAGPSLALEFPILLLLLRFAHRSVLAFDHLFQPPARLVQLPQKFFNVLQSVVVTTWPICTARGELQWATSEGVPTWFHFHLFNIPYTLHHTISCSFSQNNKQVTKKFLKENKRMSEWKPQKPTKLDGNDTTTSIKSLGTRLHHKPLGAVYPSPPASFPQGPSPSGVMVGLGLA